MSEFTVHRDGSVCDQHPTAVVCNLQDMQWLDFCDGCFERFSSAVEQAAHTLNCVAYRDFLIEQKLAAQARDDGREDAVDEFQAAWL